MNTAWIQTPRLDLSGPGNTDAKLIALRGRTDVRELDLSGTLISLDGLVHGLRQLPGL